MGWRENMGVKNLNPQEQKPQKEQKPLKQPPFATIAPFAPIDSKIKKDHAPAPDMSRIHPDYRAEYRRLWNQAHELADYVDGNTAPYEDRIEKLPELNMLNARMTALEFKIKSNPPTPGKKTQPENTMECLNSLIRCPVGTKLNQAKQPKHSGSESCRACGQSKWWRLDKPGSKWICGECHPAAPGLDVIYE